MRSIDEKTEKKSSLMPFEEFMFLLLGDSTIDPSTINKGESVYHYLLFLEQEALKFSELIKFDLRNKKYQNSMGLINILKPLGLFFVEKKVDYSIICKDGASFAFVVEDHNTSNTQLIAESIGKCIGLWALYSDYGKKNFLFSDSWVKDKNGISNRMDVKNAFFSSWFGYSGAKDLNFDRIYNFMYYMSMCFFAMVVFPNRIFGKIQIEFESFKDSYGFDKHIESKFSIPLIWSSLLYPRLKIQKIINSLDTEEKLNFLEKL